MNSMKLEIKVISAKNIRKKNAYAKVYIDGDPNTEKQTTVDRRHKKNPKWDYTVAYPINKKDVKDNSTELTIRICSKHMFSDEFIGEVNVKFKKLFKKAGRKRKTVEYKLKNSSGKTKGKLKFSYKFLEDRPSVFTCGCMAMAMLRIASVSFLGIPTN